jgi:hypothetical protein
MPNTEADEEVSTRPPRPTDLRRLLAQGPLPSPAFARPGASPASVEPTSDPLESERTGVWSRPPEMVADESGVSSLDPRTRTRRRRFLWFAAATSMLVAVVWWRWSPSRVELASPGSKTHRMAEHVARESRAPERYQSGTPMRARERPVPMLAEAPFDEPEEERIEEDEELVLEVDVEELAALEAARLEALAAKRAKQAARLVERARRALEAGHRAEAIPMLERALELDETLAIAAAELASAHFDEGAFDRAVHFAELAVALDDSVAEHHVMLGDAYHRVGRAQEARDHWLVAARSGSTRATKRLARHGPSDE